MSHRAAPQSGFTLIEALIAFVVLTVGILGTLLFHSSLLKESGENKARLEAIKIAEDWIEARRSLSITSSAYTSNVANLAAGSTVVSGTNTSYTVSWANSSLASGAVSNIYKVDLTVSWPESNQAVQLSSYLGYLDPDKTIRPEDADNGTNGGEYTGSIKVPTGTLKELPRIEIANAAIEAAEEKRSQGAQDNIVIYRNGDDSKVAVKIDDDTYVQLAQLQDFDNEILTITGRVYLSQDSDHQVDEIFGPVYGVSAAAASVTNSPTGVFAKFNSDNIEELSDNQFWLNNIIDIRASAGASCLITRFKNYDDGEDEWQRGAYGDYLCVAGTGWNGSIKPYHRQYYFESSRGAFGSRDIDIDGMVCGPPLRSYRYYTLSVPTSEVYTLGDFEDDISKVGSDAVTSIADVLADSGATVVGQSGLVRFYKDETALSNSLSGEGVLWDNFFWQNPNYIVSPDQDTAYFALTPSVEAPELVQAGTSAENGYQTPKVTSVSTPSYEVHFPGDVAHQNFYISSVNTGPRTWDCESVWRSFVDGSDFLWLNAADYPNQVVSGSNTSYHKHGHLVAYGLPGYLGDSAYLPPYSSSTAEVSDYNNYNTDLSTGAIILGYTLATESISGQLTFRSDLASLADFSLGGNPEPVISVECIPDVEPITETGSLATYEFECAVPSNWRGYIFAFNNSDPRKIDADTPVSVSGLSEDIGIGNIDEVASGARDPSDASTPGNTAVTYFFNLAAEDGGLAANTVSAAEFSFLATEYVDTGAGEDVPTILFQFSD